MESIQRRFYLNFIKDDRWEYILDGLGVTLKVTFFAVLLGILLGFLVAVVRSTNEKTGKLKILNVLAKVYLTVIRGTPVVVQLLIIYFVIFGSVEIDKVFVAVLAFGLNSGAYVAEIIRGGLMSVDAGQSEAGRSLGLGYFDTMRFIVIPQAFKNILPSLGNEFITLFKDTSLAQAIGGAEMLYYASTIGGRTFDYMPPLLGIAAMYLAVVIVFTWLQGRLERRLRESDRR